MIAHLVNPRFDAAEAIVREVETAGRTIGREIVVRRASTEAEIDATFATLRQREVGGLLVAADPFFHASREQLVLWSVRLGLPAVFEQREFVVAGGLMSYSTSITDAYRQMGVYVPASSRAKGRPICRWCSRPNSQLVVNLKTAKTLGLTMPSGLMSIIDEVIE